MKINLKVRVRNPYFWIGLLAVVLAAIGVTPESLTSWDILYSQIMQLLGNPFALSCVVVAVVGYINDPTTAGLRDSNRALTYKKPAK